MRALAIVATVVLLAAALPLGGAQNTPQGFKYCGDPELMTLIFVNPDLNKVADDGYVHASGTFFIQFQAIGPDAAKVAKIAFSFGKPLPDGTEQCSAQPEPVTGAYIYNYRSDADARDGFFVPINTTLVPDGEYGAAITAYDSSGAYLSRFYAKALVENSPSCFPSRSKCEDKIVPWPMILPGDGEQTNPLGGLTIEYAEPVQDVLVRINGQQVIPQPWVPPGRDDDAKPDNDGEDCSQFDALTPVWGGQNFVCHRVIWGNGFHLARELKDGDVIEVRAIDLAGNEATKVVNVGGVTQGGTIVLATPELQLSAESTEQSVEAGQPAEWRVKMVNVGQGAAEARMTVQAPNGTALEWSSPAVTIEAGQEQVVTLKATPARDMRPGTYALVAKSTYKSGTEDVTKQLPLTLQVQEYRPVAESPLRQNRLNQTAGPAEQDQPPRQAPGAEPLLLAGALALVAFAARRRR